MKKSVLALSALLAACISAAQAAPPYYYYPGARPMHAAPQAPQSSESPSQIVRQGIDRLKGFLARGGAAKPSEVRSFLNKEITPYFDFDYMAKWVGGRRYAQMDDAAKARFAGKLKELFFSALARNLGTYSDSAPRIDVYPARAKPYSREVKVMARVRPENGYPMRLEFRFYRGSEGWKIFDVTANGTSAVVYYRNYFQNLAARGGGR